MFVCMKAWVYVCMHACRMFMYVGVWHQLIQAGTYILMYVHDVCVCACQFETTDFQKPNQQTKCVYIYIHT